MLSRVQTIPLADHVSCVLFSEALRLAVSALYLWDSLLGCLNRQLAPSLYSNIFSGTQMQNGVKEISSLTSVKIDSSGKYIYIFKCLFLFIFSPKNQYLNWGSTPQQLLALYSFHLSCRQATVSRTPSRHTNSCLRYNNACYLCSYCIKWHACFQNVFHKGQEHISLMKEQYFHGLLSHYALQRVCLVYHSISN